MAAIISKIKNLLQANQSIGKIDSPVPLILSTTMELFITDIITTSLSLIKKLKKKKIRTKHIKYILKNKIRFNNFSKTKQSITK
jgi:hypothetical protein